MKRRAASAWSPAAATTWPARRSVASPVEHGGEGGEQSGPSRLAVAHHRRCRPDHRSEQRRQRTGVVTHLHRRPLRPDGTEVVGEGVGHRLERKITAELVGTAPQHHRLAACGHRVRPGRDERGLPHTGIAFHHHQLGAAGGRGPQRSIEHRQLAVPAHQPGRRRPRAGLRPWRRHGVTVGCGQRLGVNGFGRPRRGHAEVLGQAGPHPRVGRQRRCRPASGHVGAHQGPQHGLVVGIGSQRLLSQRGGGTVVGGRDRSVDRQPPGPGDLGAHGRPLGLDPESVITAKSGPRARASAASAAARAAPTRPSASASAAAAVRPSMASTSIQSAVNAYPASVRVIRSAPSTPRSRTPAHPPVRRAASAGRRPRARRPGGRSAPGRRGLSPAPAGGRGPYGCRGRARRCSLPQTLRAGGPAPLAPAPRIGHRVDLEAGHTSTWFVHRGDGVHR